MSDDNGDKSGPVLENLVEAAKPSAGQKSINLIGLGFAGNTAVAITVVKLTRKLFPNLIEKWEARYAKKYYDRQVEKIVTPIADELDAASKAAIEEKISADAKVYGEKTVNSRLLTSGGFAVLPLQSAMEVYQQGKNINPPLDRFRSAAAEANYTEQQTQEALEAQISQQKANVPEKNKEAQKILDNALEEPKFSPLGPDARKGMPKWGTGRVLAIGSAFLVQGIVDDRFAKQKDALDTMLAKVVTRIMHPKGYKNDQFNNKAFGEDKTTSAVPEGVDPKVWSVLPMVTTDAYMTTVALLVQNKSNNVWDKSFAEKGGPINALKDKFFGNSPSI